MKNSLTIGPSWFLHERRAYSNWKTAVIRELLQNSTANNLNSTRIDLNFEDIKESTKITCIDNGKGMSRDILTNVFLVLGETSKGIGEIGGLGIARNLICFSADKYTIESHDYIVKGSGANYEITKQYRNHHGIMQGCKFELFFEKSDWINYAKYVIDRSQVFQKIYINGEYYKNNLHRGKLVRNLTFGQVWVNKSGGLQNQLIVRSGGMYMFDHSINVKAQVIVEIDPDKAKSILTSNRDGLKWDYKQELDNFLNELASDVRSALKDKTRHFTKFVNKESCFKSRPKNKRVESIKDDYLKDEAKEFLLTVANKEKEERIKSFGANPIDEEYLPTYIKCPILSSMIILNESNDPKTIQLIKNFYMPEKWENRAATRYQLIRQWFAICDIVMQELSDYVKCEFNFAVGFNFNDSTDDGETLAKHLKSDNIHYLMFNPIDNDRKLKYSVNNVDDFFTLTTFACHEASHCVYSLHNEDFSSLFTMLLTKVLARRKEIVNNCKEAKNK